MITAPTPNHIVDANNMVGKKRGGRPPAQWIDGKKVCTRCKEPKYHFPRDVKRSDGFHSWCSDCFRIVNRKRYEDKHVVMEAVQVPQEPIRVPAGYIDEDFSRQLMESYRRGDPEAEEKLRRLGVRIRIGDMNG